MGKFVVWDWNGTLFNDVQVCIDVMNEMLEHRGLPPIESVEKYREIFTFPVIKYYEAAGLSFENESFEALAAEYIEEYSRRAVKSPLYSGTEETLTAINDMGIPQVIASASRQDALFRQVAERHISRYFKALLGIGDYYAGGKEGVAREYFHRIAQPPEDILFVGDSVHDWEVARDLGSPCLLIADGHQSKARLSTTGAPVVDTIKDVPAFVKENFCQ